MSSATLAHPEYFRRDQADGVSPPDLTKDCSFAEHIVHARGKRSQFTSVSLDLARIRDFGEASYYFKHAEAARDGHLLIVHEELISALRDVAQRGEKADRLRAVQALRYATARRKGLVNWRFDVRGVDRKDLIPWAAGRVQPYFARVH